MYVFRHETSTECLFYSREGVGRSKHLRLRPVTSNKPESIDPAALNEVTEENKDVLRMESVTVVITRGHGGFAFRIAGNNPVRVSRLDIGSHADVAGLRSGDYIVRINGQNISRSTANGVARIVRHSHTQIVLDIQRPHGSKVTPGSLSSHSASENDSDKENSAPVKRIRGRPLPCQRIPLCDGALPWHQNVEDSSRQQDQKRRRVCCSSDEMRTCRKDIDLEQRTSTAPSSEQVALMAAAYGAYCAGVDRAMKLLTELQSQSMFDEFLQHLCDLVINLQWGTTCEQSSTSLLHVISVLRNCCNQINSAVATTSRRGRQTLRSRSSMTSETSSQLTRSSSASWTTVMSGSSSLYAKRVVVKVDNQHDRLAFPKHQKGFKSTGDSRHIIYTGELLLEARRPVKVWAVLLRDRLLLTSPNSENRLVVVNNTVYVHDVVRHDFTRPHPLEFVVMVNGCHGDGETLTFWAPNIEQKTTWCEVLLERMTAQRSVSDSNGDSFL